MGELIFMTGDKAQQIKQDTIRSAPTKTPAETVT